MTRPDWDRAKLLLEEFDGGATEIFVVGVPLTRLDGVVARLAELPAVEVTDYDEGGIGSRPPFDAAWRARFVALPRENVQRALISASGTARHLQIYLWLDPYDGTLDVELVFWNDMTFPTDVATAERARRFDALVSLAENLRAGAPDARCVLSSEHNGSAHELFESPFRERCVVW